jgi:hypothetical protein
MRLTDTACASTLELFDDILGDEQGLTGHPRLHHHIIGAIGAIAALGGQASR